MCIIRWFVVISLALVVLGRMETSSEAGRPKAKPSAHPVAAPDSPTREFTGTLRTVEEARKLALEKAVDWVGDYLATEWDEHDWKPSAALLCQLDAVREVGKPEPVKLEVAGEVWSVTLQVELTPQVLEGMQKQIRGLHQEERQRLAARWLVGVLSLLAVGFGYLKLEDATKGYYTLLLRLAAVATLSIAGFWIWMLS